jgi:hypothetical protein
MSKIEALGTQPSDNSDWDHALDVVRMLAAARAATRPRIEQEPASHRAAEAPGAGLGPTAPDQLARHAADIEKAAAALRRLEPALEPRIAGQDRGSEPPALPSVWMIVGAAWVFALSVATCAATAVLLLFS